MSKSEKKISRTSLDRGNRVSISFPEKGRTHQSFKDECDINNILARYNKTGQLPGMIQENPRYGDFSSPHDYQESLNLVLFAQEQFAALPAHVRERFSNDPQRFLTFATDGKNTKELIALGLATERVQSSPQGDVSPTPGKSSHEPPKGSKTKVTDPPGSET